MASSKSYSPERYPASWREAVRMAFASPGKPALITARSAEPASALETQQRKLRAFVQGYAIWPRVEPAVSTKLSAGWQIKTHRRVEGPAGAQIATFYLTAHPPRAHEIELVKKALAGG